MPIYRQVQVAETITVAAPVATSISLEIRGSEDNYATNRRDFSTEEDVRVNGAVIAADGANLSSGVVEVYVDGVFRGNASLTFTAGVNYYVLSLGLLAEASYEIMVRFPRLRLYMGSQAVARIGTRAEIPPALAPAVMAGAAITVGAIILVIASSLKGK